MINLNEWTETSLTDQDEKKNQLKTTYLQN